MTVSSRALAEQSSNSSRLCTELTSPSRSPCAMRNGGAAAETYVTGLAARARHSPVRGDSLRSHASPGVSRRVSATQPSSSSARSNES